ncbi:Protein kintoun [Melipona quadrifasciata]|uniref:Protein kintoun n=1 Tax=Melipona quadrifasciata TaxID=166423 RepID=A0A0M9ABJ0_9HYME|nr:Protein kintoun [Melipona quadrifasciata]
MDAYDVHRRNWEDLDVTREELNKLTECLKKEEFRKMLVEYVEEVTDPKNVEVYQNEITQLEKARGVDVTFVSPQPSYVIKTSVNGDQKCFINVCTSEHVQPSFKQGDRGQWSIPHLLTPPRDDLDKKNVRCKVFDVIFHPDTIFLFLKHTKLRKIIDDTAMDGVENNFNVELDRKNIKFPHTRYMGVCHPTVIRKPSKDVPEKKVGGLDIDPEIYQKLMASYDESRQQQLKRAEKVPKCSPSTKYYNKKLGDEDDQVDVTKFAKPKFTIKYRTNVELEDFGNSRYAKMNATVPKALIVVVNLPLLKTATDATLDVQERSFCVQSVKPAKYLLQLPLPYRVDADNGSAKFDQKHKKLVVTLPVVETTIPIYSPSTATEDDETRGSDGNSAEDSSSQSQVIEDSSSISKLMEECETVFAATKIEQESENVEDSSDTTLRTTSAENASTFLDSNIKYSLPTFICNIYKKQLTMTVNIKNVDPNSIRYRILQNNVGMHVSLTSVGAGFFPQHYSLCFKITENTFLPETFAVDPWDNNVVFSITLKTMNDVTRYYVGLDEEFMEEKHFPNNAALKKVIRDLIDGDDDDNNETDRTVDVRPEDDGLVINIAPNHLNTNDEVEHSTTSIVEQRNLYHIMSKNRSVSESSGDELTISESSADENGTAASSVECHYDSIQDLNFESDSASLKKTVRFNDVVSRQLFRSNSSILGQRKKNQRKLRNKRRAHERKMSESENSETEERDKYKANQKNAETSEASIKEETNEIYSSETHKNEVKAQFKNDLIFDLDM